MPALTCVCVCGTGTLSKEQSSTSKDPDIKARKMAQALSLFEQSKMIIETLHIENIDKESKPPTPMNGGTRTANDVKKNYSETHDVLGAMNGCVLTEEGQAVASDLTKVLADVFVNIGACQKESNEWTVAKESCVHPTPCLASPRWRLRCGRESGASPRQPTAPAVRPQFVNCLRDSSRRAPCASRPAPAAREGGGHGATTTVPIIHFVFPLLLYRTIHHPPSTIHHPPSTIHHPPCRYLKAKECYLKEFGRMNLPYARCLVYLGNLDKQEAFKSMQQQQDDKKVVFAESAVKEYEEALKVYQQVVGKDQPDNAGILTNIGMVFQIKGDAASARNNYELALAIYKKWATFKPREQQLLDRIKSCRPV